MTYPTATLAVEPEPPLSLTASDGTGVALVSLDARAVIDGPLAFTELHLRFRNPRDRIIEGRFAITLPPDAVISRLAMRLETGWQEAEVVERQLAQRAYEDFLHRRQDPALLEKEAGNEFRARIFPIPARGDKDIVISYSQPIAGQNYRLPLRGLPEIEHLKVSALVGEPKGIGQKLGYHTAALEEHGYKPTKDFEVAAPTGIAGISAGELVAMRLLPEIKTGAQEFDSLVVLFDTSASRAPGFSSQVRRLGELVGELARARGDVHLEVAAFDQAVAPIHDGPISSFSEEALDKLRAHRPLGASNLDAALAWAATREKRARLLIISDAIPTMGPIGADDLTRRVRALAPATERVDVLLAGGIRDQELAHTLVRGTLARDGVVLDAGEEAAALAKRMSLATVSGVTVAIPGAEWVWPERLDGLQPGDEVLVFASLGKAAAGSVAVTLRGAIEQTARISLTPVARPLIERAAVAAHIARLGHERDALAADAREARERAKQRIVELSTRYRVLSDFTALLVLETEDDYRRFGIDRRSLADILTIGASGVEVFHRQAPVIMVADGRDPTDGHNTDSKQTGKKKGKSEEKAYKMSEADDNVADLGGKDAEVMDNDADGILDREDESKEQAEEATGEATEEPARAEPPRPEMRPPVAAPPPASTPPAQTRGHVATDTPADTRSFARHESAASGVAQGQAASRLARVAAPEPEPTKPSGPPPYTGKMAEIMAALDRGEVESALVQSIRWQSEEPGAVMALLALGESLERSGRIALAARAYGSIIDLFPSRADMRRFAGERLERLARLDTLAQLLVVDTYAKAVDQRPDHLTGHRLLAYALVRTGDYERAFTAAANGLARHYPEGRFLGGERILREDLGLIAAAWIRAKPEMRTAVLARLAAAGSSLATKPSLRFVLNWETDANDVDFHIYDGRGGHAYFSDKTLPSGGELYADVTTGYGPECFTIDGAPSAYPYSLQIHYYSRGPMGYGMGKLEIVEHDGQGNLRFEERPFTVMNDSAYVDLGTVEGAAAIAR